jgi:cysteine synthase B
MIYNNVLGTIGSTPMVTVNNIRVGTDALILAKLEGRNPGGSIKDRIAVNIINDAEADGRLTSDKTIIEPTSGNTGIGLAMVGAVKGYKVRIVMSEAVSEERRKMICAFGADIILTDGKLGTDGAIKKAREIAQAEPNKYFMPDQFSNNSNIMAHYKTTAEEIWAQTGGKIDYFVSALGTSGTIMGVGKYLKEKDPAIRIVSAHPVRGHYIQGLKNMEEAVVPAIYDEKLIDETVMVGSEEAFATTREIVLKEGIFVGMSSGAAMYAALETAKRVGSGRIVVIFPDRGEKYLSTDLFSK